MSFWKKAGEVSVAVGKSTMDQVKKMNDFKEETKTMDDKKLIKIYKSSFSGTYEKKFAGLELSNRGYKQSDI